MYIDNNGNFWYKGNLHTHTSRSDGAFAPADTLKAYKKNEYDFIALTDHWIISDTKNEYGILQLTGCEYDTGSNALDGIYHILGIGFDKNKIKLKHESPSLSAQTIVNEITNAGGMAFLAHPAWSLNSTEQIKKIKNIHGVEIFNSVADLPWNVRPYSGVIIDRLAAEGYLLPCIATDDTHFYKNDLCRSFIWVKAIELSREAIMDAIKKGDFIASQAPFFSVERNGDTIEVFSTPVSSIIFFSDTVYTPDRINIGENLTYAKYKIKTSDTFIRIELTDAAGKTAWSSPVKA